MSLTLLGFEVRCEKMKGLSSLVWDGDVSVAVIGVSGLSGFCLAIPTCSSSLKSPGTMSLVMSHQETTLKSAVRVLGRRPDVDFASVFQSAVRASFNIGFHSCSDADCFGLLNGASDPDKRSVWSEVFRGDLDNLLCLQIFGANPLVVVQIQIVVEVEIGANILVFLLRALGLNRLLGVALW